MAGQFVLRSEGDANNPSAARLYGKGITQGRVVFYKNDGEGSQTYFLAILAQGARFRNDLGCDSIVRVYYAGFELPEFTDGARNWKFHKGTVAKAPDYKAIQSIDTATDIWQVTGHGYANGDLIAFHKRGESAIMPSIPSGKVAVEAQYMALVVDANHIKVLNQLSGAPDSANTLDVTDSGTNLNLIFVYKADALYFDAAQGRPEFFPTLNFTFSGLSYIEVRLPVHLSTGEDEPSQLKVIMNGKQVYGIQAASGGGVNEALTSTVTPSSVISSSFPAESTIDGLRHTNNLWGSGGGWNSNGNPSVGSPEWLELDFGSAKTITTVNVITLADAINYNTNPTLADTFTLYGIVDYKVQYWSGSAWIDIPETIVTANNKVWRTFSFAPIVTDKLRLYITLGAASGFARVVEFEAISAGTVSGALAFDTATITGEPNPALVAADLCVNDAAMPLTRLHAASFVNWRDKADGVIDWIGGNDNPAPRAGFPVYSNVAYDVATAKLVATAPSGYAYTEEFTSKSPSLEFVYHGGNIDACFSDTTVYTDDHKQGIEILSGTLSVRTGNVTDELTTVSAGDRIKITYESGLLNVYKNSIPLPLVNTSQSQLYTTYRFFIFIENDAEFIEQILVAPSGTNSVPRQVKRFYGGLVAPQPTPVSDLFETLILLSGGMSWADIDGQIRIATEPDRTPCFTFRSVTGAGGEPANASKVTPKRKQDPPNFWSYAFRDYDDFILSRKYVTVDRKERRAALGGRLIKAELQNFSVMTQSHMERLGEEFARLQTDLDVFFSVEGFLDSIEVVRGSFVYLISPEAGYIESAPALCIVNEINYLVGSNDVETVVYELQVITPDFYSDTAHGAVTPVQNAGNQNAFTPPYPASTLILSETLEPLPDGRYVSSISGLVQFANGFNQHGRLFTKVLTDKLGDVTLSSGSDIFSLPSGRMPTGTEELSLGSSADDMPTGASYDTIYFAVNINLSTNTFQLSRTLSGAPDSFASNGSGLKLYGYAGWTDTSIDVFPNADLLGGFEIIPARKSLTAVRIETRSAADVAIAFVQQKTSAIAITGDVVPPNAPAYATYYYDGVNIRFDWLSSPSFGVESYAVKDEADRLLTVTRQLSYAEPARAESVTRRIYAVSSSGVLSSGYAEVTFFRPPEANWTAPSGLTINPDGSVTKTAASFSFTNNSATFSLGDLTDAVNSRISFAPDAVMGQRLDFVSEFVGSPFYEYAFEFESSGLLTFLYNDYGAPPIFNPTTPYEAGTKFIFEPATGRVFREDFSENVRKETLVHTFLHPLAFTRFPLLLNLHLETNGETSRILIHVEGDLIPAIRTVPPAVQNPSNVTYAGGVLTTTGGVGWGSSGASFPNPLENGRDGGWTVRTSGALAFGLSVTDADTLNTSIRYRLERTAAGAYTIYANGASVASGTGLGASYVFVGRENGEHVFRINGELIYSWADATLFNADIILDTAFRNDLSAGSNLTQIGEAFAFNGESGSQLSGAADNGQAAFVGKNRADAIPAFNITAPANGQVLKLLTDGTVTSVDAPAKTAPATLGSLTGTDTVNKTQLDANLTNLKNDLEALKTQLQTLGILE